AGLHTEARPSSSRRVVRRYSCPSRVWGATTAMTSITEVLILRGLVPVEALRPGTAPEDEERIVRTLIEQGTITPTQLASARAAQAGLPFVELVDFPVDPQAVALVPAAVARRYEL